MQKVVNPIDIYEYYSFPIRKQKEKKTKNWNPCFSEKFPYVICKKKTVSIFVKCFSDLFIKH